MKELVTPDWRKIFAVGNIAVLITLTFSGCSGSQKPVDVSQRILVEMASALNDIDQSVSSGVQRESEEAIERAVTRVEGDGCEENEDRGDCVVRFVREEMSLWYRLTAALESAHGTMEAWEQANNAWRASDDRPDDWVDVVCDPVRTMIQTVMDLLDEIGINTPENWRALIDRADVLCELGVVVSDFVRPMGATQ